MNKLTGVVHREYHTAVVERLEQRIAELELAHENYKSMVIEQKQRIVELDEALRALACEYEYQVCADEHYDKAMEVANSTGTDS